MALIVSAASGNFNAGATWVGGVVPTVGDEARASTGHTVTITASVTCDEISNAGTGTYVLNNGVTLTANVTHKSVTLAVNCLSFSAASPATATIVGNCTGGSTNDAVAVANTSSGLLTITGNLTANTSRAYGANNTSVGTINATGNITGGQGVTPYGVNNNSTGAIIVTGNVTAGSSASGNGIRNLQGGTLNITGSVLAVNASGISNATTGAVTITGSITASNTNHGLECTNTTGANITLSGSLISAPNGLAATNCAKFLMNPTPSTAFVRFAKNGTTTFSDFYTADNNLDQAAPSNVRAGTVYANGNLTGSCAVPAAGSVALGVPVDNATGTAALTPAAVWEYATRALTTSSGATAAEIRAEMDSNSTKLANLDAAVSTRLAPSGTLATVTTLTNSPNVPSAAAIADEVRVELATELARIDAPVSGATAPSAATVATAVRSELATELARVDVATSTRLATSGYTAPSAAPTVAAIRTEMDSNSTKLANLDATVSSRLASSVSINITAIKAKTDLLNTDRLAQCATTSIVGNLIAQSNS